MGTIVRLNKWQNIVQSQWSSHFQGRGLDITVVELCYGSSEPQIDPQRLCATVKTI